jgi:hypothetical protein
MSEPDLGGSLQDLPNEKYKKFFDSFAEIDSLEISKWKVNHLIGYFCKLYKQKYQIDYKFKFNSPAPSKCYEVFQVKKLGQILTSDPVKLKKYIDWAFEEKSKFAKRRITSIAFLSTDYLVTEYKLKYLAGDLSDQKIDRTTLIPPEYMSIITRYKYQISTYGELAFVFQMKDESADSMLQELAALGLNIEEVKKIS